MNTELKSEDYISETERQHLLSELHRLLVWVGEPLPDSVDINGEIVDAHKVVWWCIHKKEFTDQEKARFKQLIHLLEIKEKNYEDILQTANLTHEEAEKLYHEIASINRAIMDIKDCEDGNIQLKESEVGNKTEDAKRWIDFLKSVGKQR